MKIGILTFHRSFNYGAFMQCYSLWQKIKRDFPQCSVEVIDYTVKKVMNIYEAETDKYKSPIKEKIIERNQAFLKVRNTLPLSEFCEVSDDYQKTVEYMNENYDAVVVGSDAVWNWVLRGFPNLYFLKDYKGKKFSYAASAHGMNYQNMTDEQKKYLKEAFDQFEYIGVRDETTENMVKFVSDDLTVNHNCDPTAFLDIDNVPCDINLLKQKLVDKGIDFSKPIIGIMASNVIGKAIKKRFKGKAQLVALYTPNKYADVLLNDLTPYEWAKTFSFFNVTVTHFFHGTMLSLVNGVPVIPVEFDNSFSKFNKTKIKDVMERLGLTEWYFRTDNANKNIMIKVLRKFGIYENKPLWNKVNALIEKLIASDNKEIIKQKLSKEAESYKTFYEALKKLD